MQMFCLVKSISHQILSKASGHEARPCWLIGIEILPERIIGGTVLVKSFFAAAARFETVLVGWWPKHIYVELTMLQCLNNSKVLDQIGAVESSGFLEAIWMVDSRPGTRRLSTW